MNLCHHSNYSPHFLDSESPPSSLTTTLDPTHRPSPLPSPSPSRQGQNMTPMALMTCDLQAVRSAQSSMVMQHMVLTVLVLTVFVGTKSYYNYMRRQMARCTVFVIGAGPTGLTSALIASQSPHVSRVVVYEEMTKSALIARAHQVEFNRKSRDFLSCLGVDFDSLEGCLESNIFHTRVGVVLEHLLGMLALGPVLVKFGAKFGRENVAELERYPGRKVVVASDGSSGQSARLLGLSDEFVHSSCHAFGAVASMDRTDQSSVPLAERRVHGLVFDLTAYGLDMGDHSLDGFTGFSLKMFGSTRHRYMSIALPKAESTLVKHMRLVLDRSMMRNIFIKCFNTCKWASEAELNEAWALRNLNFSPRLFDIKLFQRLETVAYFQDTDMFVMVEGEAARCCNFHTGLDVNMALAGLSSLPSTIDLATSALTEMDILNTMLIKSRHSETIAKQFLKNGLKQDMFTQCY